MWGEKSDKQPELLSEEDNYTFFGKGVDFKGTVKFDGAIIRINGHLEGEVNANDTLIVGEQAVIKGTITCGVIVCKGRIEGNITATQKIQMLKPAVLIGDVKSPSFSMEDGVLFRGQCDMDESTRDTLPAYSNDGETG